MFIIHQSLLKHGDSYIFWRFLRPFGGPLDWRSRLWHLVLTANFCTRVFISNWTPIPRDFTTVPFSCAMLLMLWCLVFIYLTSYTCISLDTTNGTLQVEVFFFHCKYLYSHFFLCLRTHRFPIFFRDTKILIANASFTHSFSLVLLFLFFCSYSYFCCCSCFLFSVLCQSDRASFCFSSSHNIVRGGRRQWFEHRLNYSCCRPGSIFALLVSQHFVSKMSDVGSGFPHRV